jgi:lysophospholipase L1-like esterase
MLARKDKTHVIVVSIPDYGVTPFGGGNASISVQIDQFNAINKRITDLAGITYLNVTTMSRAAATDNTLLANDGLHYSAKEYGYWADSLAPLMKKVLR